LEPFKMSRTKVAIAALGLALASSPASAFFIDNAGDSLNFSWSYAGGGYNVTGAGTMTATALSSGSLTLQISLTNTTVAPNANDARLTAFGLGIDPDATGVTFSDASDGGMINASLDNIPSLKTIEVCAFGGPNCSGGGNGGIFANGASDTFSLTITGAFANGATIDPLGYKYQTDDASPYEFSCSTTSTTGQCGGGRTVPEPGSLALLGVTAVACATIRRRRSPPITTR
jgi:hypothetical protein